MAPSNFVQICKWELGASNTAPSSESALAEAGETVFYPDNRTPVEPKDYEEGGKYHGKYPSTLLRRLEGIKLEDWQLTHLQNKPSSSSICASKAKGRTTNAWPLGRAGLLRMIFW
jgi:hypothetical protein